MHVSRETETQLVFPEGDITRTSQCGGREEKPSHGCSWMPMGHIVLNIPKLAEQKRGGRRAMLKL